MTTSITSPRFSFVAGEVIDATANNGHGGVIGKISHNPAGYWACRMQGDKQVSSHGGFPTLDLARHWVEDGAAGIAAVPTVEGIATLTESREYRTNDWVATQDLARTVIEGLTSADLDTAISDLDAELTRYHEAGDLYRRGAARTLLTIAQQVKNIRQGGATCHCGGLITPDLARQPYRSQCVGCDDLDAQEGAHYRMLAARGIG